MARAEHKATPKVIGGWLYWEAASIKLDTPAWDAWLAEHTTFYYEADGGTFTARRDLRWDGFFWYAYRRHKGKLHKLYLGKPQDLRATRLQAVAYHLADKAGA